MAEVVASAPKAAPKKPAAKPEVGPVQFAADGRRRRKWTIKYWSIRHSGFMEKLYNGFERVLLLCAPVLKMIGHERLEKPVAALERTIKGVMFDCRMCGKCALSSTGMSCSMNCPKQLRNGPCGGVRANGHCEVIPDMPCVWVKAWEGADNMSGGNKIMDVQKPVDQSIRETSTWLRVIREKTNESASV
ncbi:MAG: methylenetetrahydrofolate reductase C-terminal domain-containing protein [Rhizobiaceae bacterium]